MLFMPQKLQPDVVSIRRQRLRQWIEQNFDGSQVAFIANCAQRGHEINQGELSGLLKLKSFGEKKARSLELQAEMPRMYLDGITQGQMPSEPLAARENVGTYLVKPVRSKSDWPFNQVTPIQYKLLTSDEQRAVEDLAIMYVGRHVAKKRSAPEKKTAA